MGEKIRLFNARELERLISRYGFVMSRKKAAIENGAICPLAAKSLFHSIAEEHFRSEHSEVF